MLRAVYCVIIPNKAYEQLLLEYPNTDITYLFSRPFLFKDSREISLEVTEEDYIVRAKLAFLLGFHRECAKLQDALEMQFLERIFGPAPIKFTSSLFDKWWQLETTNYMDDVEDVLKSASLEELKSLDASSSLKIQNWLQACIQYMESRHISSS